MVSLLCGTLPKSLKVTQTCSRADKRWLNRGLLWDVFLLLKFTWIHLYALLNLIPIRKTFSLPVALRSSSKISQLTSRSLRLSSLESLISMKAVASPLSAGISVFSTSWPVRVKTVRSSFGISSRPSPSSSLPNLLRILPVPLTAMTSSEVAIQKQTLAPRTNRADKLSFFGIQIFLLNSSSLTIRMRTPPSTFGIYVTLPTPSPLSKTSMTQELNQSHGAQMTQV